MYYFFVVSSPTSLAVTEWELLHCRSWIIDLECLFIRWHRCSPMGACDLLLNLRVCCAMTLDVPLQLQIFPPAYCALRNCHIRTLIGTLAWTKTHLVKPKLTGAPACSCRKASLQCWGSQTSSKILVCATHSCMDLPSFDLVVVVPTAIVCHWFANAFANGVFIVVWQERRCSDPNIKVRGVALRSTSCPPNGVTNNSTTPWWKKKR